MPFACVNKAPAAEVNQVIPSVEYITISPLVPVTNQTEPFHVHPDSVFISKSAEAAAVQFIASYEYAITWGVWLPATHINPFHSIVNTEPLVKIVDTSAWVQLTPSGEYAITGTAEYCLPTATHREPFQARSFTPSEKIAFADEEPIHVKPSWEYINLFAGSLN